MLNTEIPMACAIERKKTEFEDFGRFTIKRSRTFSNQFCEIYNARLAALGKLAEKRAKEIWKHYQVCGIADLADEEKRMQPCILIGTIYKYQAMKPSILKELSEELQSKVQPPRTTYCSTSDCLFLEDQSLRIKLIGNLAQRDVMCTGLVCGVLGSGLEDGSFVVEDFCFPGFQVKLTMGTPCPIIREGKFLLLLSGLDFANSPRSLSLDLLMDWITGMIGNETEQQEMASIARIIIAGNSVRSTLEVKKIRSGYVENRTRNNARAAAVSEAVHRLDLFLSEIAKSCPIVLMPGEFDPSSHSVPQYPLHPHMLPETFKKGENVLGVTNPWIGRIDSKIVAGSSGQPILDVMRTSSIDDSPLNWLERTLEWKHFAPTAPDTLDEYPFQESDGDPFVMKECPNIYFAGNMNEFQTKLVSAKSEEYANDETVRLICIPKFSTSKTAVLVDLNTLDTRPVTFGTS